MKVQKKVLSRADAERRLIGQEARLKESERQIKEGGFKMAPRCSLRMLSCLISAVFQVKWMLGFLAARRLMTRGNRSLETRLPHSGFWLAAEPEPKNCKCPVCPSHAQPLEVLVDSYMVVGDFSLAVTQLVLASP